MEKRMDRIQRELEEVLETDQDMDQQRQWWIACHPIKHGKWLGARKEQEMSR